MEIKLTDAAISAALQILKNEIAGQKAGEEKYVGVRIKIVGGGCGGFAYEMNLEIQTEIREGRDMEFEFGENEKLKIVADRFSMQYLDGVTIDFTNDGLGGAGFKFENPNVKSKCGCGGSFSD
ncbi:iron-sulfur cluster assembly accessory protein [Candidatus Uhrbacteria bacterium]|nr:iron-sulfur cluster assembly accessory protein [Candidatus Uhrbacteria bacterium]